MRVARSSAVSLRRPEAATTSRSGRSVGVTARTAMPGLSMIRSVASRSGGSFRKQRVAWAWGSRSTRRVRRPFFARPAATLTAVVVLPTPPLVLVTVMIMARLPSGGPCVRGPWIGGARAFGPVEVMTTNYRE